MHFQRNRNNASELINFNNSINTELIARKILVLGSLETKRNSLLVRMKNENELNNLNSALNHVNPHAKAFYSLLTVIAFILHR